MELSHSVTRAFDRYVPFYLKKELFHQAIVIVIKKNKQDQITWLAKWKYNPDTQVQILTDADLGSSNFECNALQGIPLPHSFKKLINKILSSHLLRTAFELGRLGILWSPECKIMYSLWGSKVELNFTCDFFLKG